MTRILSLRINAAPPFEPVNCYLILDEEIVLIDTGPNQGISLTSLRDNLRLYSLDLKDISTILITHGHPDHYGLASKIQELSGAEIYIHREDYHRIIEYDLIIKDYINEYKTRIKELGLPTIVFDYIKKYYSLIMKYHESPRDVNTFDNQMWFTGSAWIRSHHVPGHTDGSNCYVLESEYFIGDLVTFPNFIPPLNNVKKWKDSLLNLISLNPKTLHPAHGPYLVDPRTLQQALNVLENRLMNLLTVLRRPMTTYEIVNKLYGKLEGKDIFEISLIILRVRQVERYLKYLKDQGKVDYVIRAGKKYYFKTSSSQEIA